MLPMSLIVFTVITISRTVDVDCNVISDLYHNGFFLFVFFLQGPNSILVAMVMLLNIGLAIIFVHFLT